MINLRDTLNIKNERILNIFSQLENTMENLFKNKLKKIILYGSYARNEQTEESDMDIMVLVDESQEVLKKYDEIVTDIMVDLSLKFNIVLSIYLQSYQEYNKYNNVLPFFCNIEREGIQIYG